jgi:hypothetical protein
MDIYSLYIKTHKITGLKYLGQTKNDPFKYTGSGVDWTIHLKQYGNDHITEVVFQTTDRSQIGIMGRYYSRLWNVVKGVDDFGNKIWANMIPETGGGSSSTGKIIINNGINEKRHDINSVLPKGWSFGRLANIGCKIGKKQQGTKKPGVSIALSGRVLSKEHVNNSKIGSKTFMESMSLEERQQYYKDVGASISASVSGVPKTEKHKEAMRKGMKIHRASLTQEEKDKTYGSINKNKTWKLIDGKRVWFPKEN